MQYVKLEITSKFLNFVCIEAGLAFYFFYPTRGRFDEALKMSKEAPKGSGG